MTDVLDNAVWHAASGPQAHLARSIGRAARFDPAVSVFAAVAAHDEDAWADLASLTGAKPAILLAREVIPAGAWTIAMRIPCLQMVATGATPAEPDPAAVRLDAQDVPEMLALVELTRPGPFESRTIEMGAYYGLRDEGRLIAISGERMHCPGYTEVSAVCTAPDRRGEGLGRRLVATTIAGIRARGEEAFLHVASDNTSAIALYESMGFTVRCEAEAVAVVADDPPEPSGS